MVYNIRSIFVQKEINYRYQRPARHETIFRVRAPGYPDGNGTERADAPGLTVCDVCDGSHGRVSFRERKGSRALWQFHVGGPQVMARTCQYSRT